jgi:hypothetical protein
VTFQRIARVFSGSFQGLFSDLSGSFQGILFILCSVRVFSGFSQGIFRVCYSFGGIKEKKGQKTEDGIRKSH